MGLLDKLRRKKKKPTSDTVQVPEEWVKDKQLVKSKGANGVLEYEIRKSRKVRVPGLRTVKRVLAALLLIVNFAISQAALISNPLTQPLFWLFLLNSFILLDYLWKTRDRPDLVVSK